MSSPDQIPKKRKHWTDDFFKHLDAWGEEMRKAERKGLEDQADGRAAARAMKGIKEGKEKAIPAEEVYARLGI